MIVLATSLENAPRPHSKIRAKVLAKPIKTNAEDRGTSAKSKEKSAKDCEMSARNKLIRFVKKKKQIDQVE